jgi:thiamine monophosphate synthase
LLVQVESSDVVSSPERGEEVGRAVAAGATGVVLSDASGDGSQLYEAAVRLKGLLRGRAPLLLLDRIDIAQAADADGVLLTDKGRTEHFLGCSISFHASAKQAF